MEFSFSNVYKKLRLLYNNQQHISSTSARKKNYMLALLLYAGPESFIYNTQVGVEEILIWNLNTIIIHVCYSII